MTRNKSKMGNFWKGILPILLYTAIPVVFIILQPNLSMVIILGFTVMMMLFFGGAKVWQLGLLALAAVAVLLVLIFTEEYRANRFQSWSGSQDQSYQVKQSLYAFGNGGFFGTGLNYSRQKLLFLPYRESDFILSIIGEELGFVGCFLLLAAYGVAVWRGFRIAARSRERFGALLAAGISGVLALQVIINVGVVTAAIPATGQTLPFISSGGTSLIVFMASTGILLNISRYTEVKGKNGHRQHE